MVSSQMLNCLNTRFLSKHKNTSPCKLVICGTYRWQNGYRDEAVIEECRVVRNFSEPENLDSPMKLASARYEVKIDADAPRVADVKLSANTKSR